MDFPERIALVVEGAGKAPKAMISEEAARALTAGAQPLSGTNIFLVYQGTTSFRTSAWTVARWRRRW